MNDDFDFNLSADQWEALKALRSPLSRDRLLNGYMVEDLVRLGLVSIKDGLPAMTEAGRRVLVRGSCQLLDLVA
jgi:hypothetical protein